MRALLIEDDPKLGPTLAKLLRKQGYSTDLQKDGLVGLDRALNQKYDIMLLDLNLPNKDGLEICQGVREAKISTPILMLTSRGEILDRVRGLDIGADDYLAKPFSTGELFARMRALLRRPEQTLPAKLSFGDIVLDPATRDVTHEGKSIKLMPKEYALLEYLIRNTDRAVPREELLRHVWGVYSNSSSNRLEVYVRYLRSKLDKPFSTNYISTVRGVGYRLVEQN